MVVGPHVAPSPIVTGPVAFLTAMPPYVRLPQRTTTLAPSMFNADVSSRPLNDTLAPLPTVSVPLTVVFGPKTNAARRVVRPTEPMTVTSHGTVRLITADEPP